MCKRHEEGACWGSSLAAASVFGVREPGRCGSSHGCLSNSVTANNTELAHRYRG